MKIAYLDGHRLRRSLIAACDYTEASALSGTFRSAEAAAARFERATPLHPFDSRAASMLQGLLGLKAAELAEGGLAALGIVPRLGEIRHRSGIFLTVDTFGAWGVAWLREGSG